MFGMLPACVGSDRIKMRLQMVMGATCLEEPPQCLVLSVLRRPSSPPHHHHHSRIGGDLVTNAAYLLYTSGALRRTQVSLSQVPAQPIYMKIGV